MEINFIINKASYKRMVGIGRPDILIRLECEQLGNSFKSRGIVNFLKYQKSINGLVTFTTGNHGIAVAAIAQQLGVKAIIVTYRQISEYKKGIIEGYGGEIHFIDNSSLDTVIDYSQDLAHQNSFTFVPLFDNQNLLDGYGQIAEEICNDFEGDLTMYFPIGSGSLLLANSKKAKKIKSNVKVIGVEPEVYQRTHGLSQNTVSKSIADCLAIDKIPDVNLELFNFIAGIQRVSEDEILESMNLIYREFDLIVEPGGAIALAAALKTQINNNVKVAVITGMNVDPALLFVLNKQFKVV